MSQWNWAPAKMNLPTTVSSALAESWSRVVFVMQVYTPASFSVTSVIVRLSEPKINLETKHSHRQFSTTSDSVKSWSKAINEEQCDLIKSKTSADSSDLSSSGSSPSSLSQVMVGTSEGSCFTLHSNTTDLPLWTTLYSGCFRIRVGSDGTGTSRLASVWID